MTRNLVSLIASAVFLIAGAASAAPIFPPLVSGEYCYKIRAAAVELDGTGVPTTTPTRSVGSRIVDGDGAVLGCVPCGPGETAPSCVTVPAIGDRAELRGFAFAGLECSGSESLASDNGGYLFFTPPGTPTLELGDVARLPIRRRPPEQIARLELEVDGVVFSP